MKVDWFYKITLGKTEYDTLCSLLGKMSDAVMISLKMTNKEIDDSRRIYAQLSAAEMLDKSDVDY